MTNCLNKTGSADLSEADLRSFGRSTGLRLKGKDPEKYGSIVRALEAGCSLRELARIFKISKNTLKIIYLYVLENLKPSYFLSSYYYYKLYESLENFEIFQKHPRQDCLIRKI